MEDEVHPLALALGHMLDQPAQAPCAGRGTRRGPAVGQTADGAAQEGAMLAQVGALARIGRVAVWVN